MTIVSWLLLFLHYLVLTSTLGEDSASILAEEGPSTLNEEGASTHAGPNIICKMSEV